MTRSLPNCVRLFCTYSSSSRLGSDQDAQKIRITGWPRKLLNAIWVLSEYSKGKSGILVPIFSAVCDCWRDKIAPGSKLYFNAVLSFESAIGPCSRHTVTPELFRITVAGALFTLKVLRQPP